MATPLHVAYLTTHYPSPSHTFIAGEVFGLQRLGMKVSPISINVVPPHDLLSESDRHEAARTFYVKSHAKAQIVLTLLRALLERPAAMLRTLRLVRRLGGWDLHACTWHLFYVIEAVVVLRHCQRIGATHLHSHFGGLPSTVAMYASELSEVRGKRSLTWSVTIHGFHEFTNERNSLLKRKVEEASFVACISDFTRSQLMRIVGDPAKWSKIHVVRCGIDLDQFRFAAREPGPVARIMVTARIVAEKGIGVLFDAAAILVERGRSIELVVVGDGPARSDLAHHSETLGLADRVHWTGMQPPSEVFRWLQEVDVFCLPSFGEGLPIVLMEAMAVGVPVVGTYLGGIPELVLDRQTGRVVPAGRADLLADALEDLITPGHERSSVVKAGRARVEELHNVTRAAQQLFALFHGVRQQ